MKKILLINTNTEKAPYPVPPLGLCMLASRLEDQFEVKIYDGVFDEGRNLVPVVQQFNPDFIGFSIRNIDDTVQERTVFYMDGILEKFIRPVQQVTTVPLILGGSGFSIFPGELMKLTGAGYGITGEAEELLPVLLSRIILQQDLSDLPNVITAETMKIKGSRQESFCTPSDLRFPEIDRWIDFNPYMARGVYSVQTKRGCSHGCIYCTYPLIEGRKFRIRNPAGIADEIEQAHKRLGYVTFEFVDSTFNDPSGHAEAICREIIKKNIRVRLRTMGMNPRHTSAGLFDLMIQAGFTQIDATPDSASPRMLKNLDKGFTRAEIEKMAVLIAKFNLPTMWFFLFGGPGEDAGTFRETLDFIDNFINPEDLVYMNSGLRIYPGTPLYTLAVKEARITAGQSVFQPAAFYCSAGIAKTELDRLILDAALLRPNCLSAAETAPPPAMIAAANEFRKNSNTTEPMFRTLLRIRKQWRTEGKL
ncbi:MAG: radical SAM protein [Bacteroidota bacterium]